MKRGPAKSPLAQGQGKRPKLADPRKSYAAIDLGTNSCRMLIAVPDEAGFHVVDGFSRVVRLGDRVAETGRFQRSAVDRTLNALSQCAERMQTRGVGMVRAVATEACRQADDAVEFIARVQKQTGLDMEIISPVEEAALTVSGCGDLIRSGYDNALVFDIGGGSTEIIWVETLLGKPARLIDMLSLPFGVVSLRDEFGPESLPTDVFHGLLKQNRCSPCPLRSAQQHFRCDCRQQCPDGRDIRHGDDAGCDVSGIATIQAQPCGWSGNPL